MFKRLVIVFEHLDITDRTTHLSHNKTKTQYVLTCHSTTARCFEHVKHKNEH